MKNEKTNHNYASVFRAVKVQEMYLDKKEEGVSNIHIWRVHIFPAFGISIRTFYRILARNAKREMREHQKHHHES